MICSNSDWNNSRSTCFGSLFGHIRFPQIEAEFALKLRQLWRTASLYVIDKTICYALFQDRPARRQCTLRRRWSVSPWRELIWFCNFLVTLRRKLWDTFTASLHQAHPENSPEHRAIERTRQ